jgi:transaldolase
MSTGLRSLVEAGTKVWLDSIDPDFLRINLERGATGATSNPIIVADILKSGRYDADLARLASAGMDDDAIAWQLTEMLVRQAQQLFLPVFQQTNCDDGYVSFELDPLIEDLALNLPHDERVRRYITLGRQWSAGQANRMIKVPATPAGIAALETLAADGIVLNVTLIFTVRQYREAREAVWRGAQKFQQMRGALSTFKSVYSVFVSRVDVYTEKHVPELSAAAQGQVGIVLAKRMWKENQDFWGAHRTPLKQEIIFASTGTKKPTDDPAKYVTALAGSDIETNPPATNEAVESSGRVITRAVDQMPSAAVVAEIDAKVDMAKLEAVLMREGVAKFADPHKELLKLIEQKRSTLVPAGKN